MNQQARGATITFTRAALSGQTTANAALLASSSACRLAAWRPRGTRREAGENLTTCRPRQTQAEAALTLIESRWLVGMQSLASSTPQLALLNPSLRLYRSWPALNVT